MPTYKYRAGYRPALKNSQVVGERLQELRDKHEGLTASIVVKDAKNKNSILHTAFEWDDSKAAHEWRLHSARHLIRSVVTESTNAVGDLRYTPTFVFATTEQGPRYESLAVVLSDEELTKQVHERAKKEFDQWAKRYEDYEVFLGIIEEAEKTFKRLEQEHSAVAQA
tara:strand:+ start:151 stop:651 length:501 start_codon:yes stop_codon:yes gene_type:complete